MELHQDINDRVKMEAGWKKVLQIEFGRPYMQNLREFLRGELKSRRRIYPNCSEYFSAFNSTPFAKVKVVILGQDPYHGPRQAHGLCFSVHRGEPIPPSLRNIFQELHDDIGCEIPSHGHLQHWADQGVLLLNATLTVEAGKAGSHQGKGWEEFTDEVIRVLNTQRDHLAFLLWGSYAQKKGSMIDRHRHLVIESSHPSPLSAYRGFLGSRPFSKVNRYLVDHRQTPIEWSIPQ